MSKKSNNKKRVVVAMSGGVDSSVVAYLLKKQGYDVIGIFLKLWEPTCHFGGKKKTNLCCDDKAMNVARQIADSLEIPFYVLKVDKLFKKEIVDNFISEYEQGRTPNPCVRCNKYIKFGYLWEKSRQLKADYLATGHYIGIKNKESRIKNQEKDHNSLFIIHDSKNNIIRSKDTIKDQTYFLSSIDPAIIPYLIFPLGNMTKSEVRAIAKKAKLPVYNKKDSMGVCFIPDGDTDSFLKHFSKKIQKSGEIVDKKGNILGSHEGLLGYTVGQKVGDDQVATKFTKNQESIIKNQEKIHDSLFIIHNSITNIPRLYVILIDSKKNRLVVGENEDCFSNEMVVKDVNILDEKRFWEMVKNKETFYAQIRGGHKAEKCKISVGAGSPRPNVKSKGAETAPLRLRIIFAKPVRAITPGQTIALYDKNVLIGGGIIK